MTKIKVNFNIFRVFEKDYLKKFCMPTCCNYYNITLLYFNLARAKNHVVVIQ